MRWRPTTQGCGQSFEGHGCRLRAVLAATRCFVGTGDSRMSSSAESPRSISNWAMAGKVFAIGLQACTLLASGYEMSAAHALASFSCTEACPVITGLQDPCGDEPDWCKNNAICINDARQATFKTCVCRPGYRGDRCDEVGAVTVMDFTFYQWYNETTFSTRHPFTRCHLLPSGRTSLTTRASTGQ